MFARWVPLARERAGAVTLVVRPALVDIFQGQFEGVDVCAYDGDVAAYECWDSIIDLVSRFPVDQPEDLPSAPYLRACSKFRPLTGAFKVGMVWATKDPLRATELADWSAVFAVPGVSFYSFQLFDLGANASELHVGGHVSRISPRN
jgi:hypothetical protein